MATPASAASLIDNNVTCQQTGATSSFVCSPFQNTVGTGREFTVRADGAGIGLNFVGNGLVITSIGLGLFETMNLQHTVIQLRNLSAVFTNPRFVSSTITRFTSGDVTLSNGTLSLDFRNTAWNRTSRAEILLDTTPAVPEPSTWALIILGFGAIGGAMRMQRLQGKRAAGLSFGRKAAYAS